MHLGAISSVFLDRPLREAARRMHELGLKAIEVCAGGFFLKNHCNPAKLLAGPAALDSFRATLAEFDLQISALAIHGEPLNPDPAIAEAYDCEFRQACALAQQLGVTGMTLLAGLPEAAPGDKAPNWILFSFPPRNMEMYAWQWEKRLIPYQGAEKGPKNSVAFILWEFSLSRSVRSEPRYWPFGALSFAFPSPF